jgi:hypothetical protein
MLAALMTLPVPASLANGAAPDPVREPRREIVAPEDIPGIADLDFTQISIPVSIGSVAISRQFPDIGGWPIQVGQERKRRRRAAESDTSKSHYHEACIFVSSAGAHAGMQRKIIAGEVIFVRQYRVARDTDDQCIRPIGNQGSSHCLRYKALSESSGMCSDTFDAGRAGRFALVAGADGGEVFYLDSDAIYHRSLHIEDGCPRFGDEPQRIAAVEADTDALFARRDDEGSVHILWPDSLSATKAAQIRYLRYEPDKRLTLGESVTLSDSASSQEANLLMARSGPVAIWSDMRFSQARGFSAKNQSKILFKYVSSAGCPDCVPTALNEPLVADDVAFDIISSIAEGSPWFAWEDYHYATETPSAIRYAWLVNPDFVRISTRQTGGAEQTRRAIIDALGEYHRRLGRGEDGPLPAVDCTRRWPDEKLRVLVPGEGFVGQEELERDDGG